MKTLLLTSAGMDVKEEILKILPKPANQIKVAHIITASKVEPSTSYVDKDRKLMEEVGFMVADIDIEGKYEDEIKKILSGFDIMYVQGGNTFYLLKAVKESGFDKVARKLIDKGMIYIGVSAGTIICGITIESGGWKNPDKNKVGLKDLSGIKLVPFNLFVHFKPEWENTFKEKNAKSKYSTRILTDKQAFLVQDDKITLVGEQPEIIL